MPFAMKTVHKLGLQTTYRFISRSFDACLRRVLDGHEFHSCRNRREINGDFQPLGECRAGKTLLPQPVEPHV